MAFLGFDTLCNLGGSTIGDGEEGIEWELLQNLNEWDELLDLEVCLFFDTNQFLCMSKSGAGVLEESDVSMLNLRFCGSSKGTEKLVSDI